MSLRTDQSRDVCVKTVNETFESIGTNLDVTVDCQVAGMQ